ncbi:hypothetical protein BKA61DRAFT_595977 [Leptodontidium sp. MPI-SDFR-AT-0119]|nr:hypothetical protein BKA61DRAFT_595977 [Leptodontidium sp. MPI-SDFR-AT-0119]
MFTRVLLTNSFIHSGVVGVCGTCCVGVDFPSEVGREGCKRGKEGAGERSGAVGFECAGPIPIFEAGRHSAFTGPEGSCWAVGSRISRLLICWRRGFEVLTLNFKSVYLEEWGRLRSE